ncbi:unnamed protein product [Cunninghamella blakesleeana]
MATSKRKSCLKNYSNNNNDYYQHSNKKYREVQFFDECLIDDIGSPKEASIKDICSSYIYTIHSDDDDDLNEKDDRMMIPQNKYSSHDQIMFRKLYQKEKTKTRLLQSKIQYLENELDKKNLQLQKMETKRHQCMKLSSLINDILCVSSSSTNLKNECTPSIDSIHDHLQIVLSNVMSISNQNKIDDYY